MFDENEFKKAQEQAKKGKKVDVPNSVLSGSTSKTQTGKKSKHKKQTTEKENQSSSKHASVQSFQDSSSKSEKKEVSPIHRESELHISNSTSQEEQKVQDQFFSTDTFDKVLKEMPTKNYVHESKRERDKLSHLQTEIRKLKQELKNMGKQNDVLMKRLEEERSKNAFLMEQRQSIELRFQEELNKNLQHEEQTDVSVEIEKPSTSVESQGEDVPQKIQELSATIFLLRQSNTNLQQQMEQSNKTISSLKNECFELREQLQQIQDTTAIKPDETKVAQSVSNQDLEGKQLVKILHANGCRDIEEQMDFVRKFSQSQHLLFWLRKLFVKDFQDFETLVEKKMYQIREGIEVSLHDAIFVKTTAKNCEISAGEDISLYAREFQNGFLVNGFRYGQVIGCSEKIVPLAKTFLLHHALQLSWESKFIPYNRRQIYIFWNLSNDETSNSILEDALSNCSEAQMKHFWDGHIVEFQDSLFLRIMASNLALFFRRAAKKINNWQP